jgi:hypothetical protein
MKMRYLVLLPLLAAATLPPPLTRAQVPVFAITPVHSKATSTGLDNRGPLALGHLMDWPTSLKTLGLYRDCPGRQGRVEPGYSGRGSFDRVV